MSRVQAVDWDETFAGVDFVESGGIYVPAHVSLLAQLQNLPKVFPSTLFNNPVPTGQRAVQGLKTFSSTSAQRALVKQMMFGHLYGVRLGPITVLDEQDKQPQPEDFDDIDDYHLAMAEWRYEMGDIL